MRVLVAPAPGTSQGSRTTPWCVGADPACILTDAAKDGGMLYDVTMARLFGEFFEVSCVSDHDLPPGDRRTFLTELGSGFCLSAVVIPLS